jgi:hypothetical protein
MRYDTPVKRASANVSSYTSNSKNAEFWVVTLLSQMNDICLTKWNDLQIHFEVKLSYVLRGRRAVISR